MSDRLDQATLSKAFKGELVPQNPDDEPASALLEKWRTLPPAKQEEVLAFVDRLTKPFPTADSPLGQKLRAIRAKIVESGVPLLSDTELEKEKRERWGDRD